MTSTTNPENFDAVYFAATHERACETLDQSRFSVRYARKEFASLAQQADLPASYQLAYGQMADNLLRAQQALENAMSEHADIQPATACIALRDIQVTPDETETIRRVITEINSAEVRLINHCESAKALMQERDNSGLIDWAMPIHYHFSVLLDLGPARAFYETCGDGDEPLRISLGSYYSDSLLDKDGTSYNWNILEGHKDNPLHADHHGYLVHCIIDHSVIPWELIAHIKEIEVQLEFYTSESVWIRSSMSLPEHFGQGDAN